MATLKTGLNQRGSLTTDSLGGPGPIAYNPAGLDTVNDRKKEIIDYIRLRLADGIVDVELDQDHYNLAITNALRRYRQKSSASVEESYAFLELLPETQEYILPQQVVQVRQIFRRGIGSLTGTTASQFEPFASGYLNTYMLVAGRVGGLANYELFVGYQELAMKMFGGYIQFSWNRVTKKLTITRKIPFMGQNPAQNISESVLLHIDNLKPDIMLLNDAQAFPWIQDYAYALSKMILGEARSKFASLAGPQGGTQLNGTALIAEGKEEIQKLEEDIKAYVDGAMPLTYIWIKYEST